MNQASESSGKIYNLSFKESALKEWKNLDHQIREQFSEKLKKIRTNPHILNNKLSGGLGYKNRDAGYRLVYTVNDDTITIVVVAIGKRDKGEVYDRARGRI